MGTGPGCRRYWYPHCPLGAVQPSSRFNENLQTSLAGVTCVFTCCAIDSILTTSVYVLCCGRYVLGDFADKYRAMSLMCISRVKYLLVSCCVRVNCIVRSLLLLDPDQHVLCCVTCDCRLSSGRRQLSGYRDQPASAWASRMHLGMYRFATLNLQPHSLTSACHSTVSTVVNAVQCVGLAKKLVQGCAGP